MRKLKTTRSLRRASERLANAVLRNADGHEMLAHFKHLRATAARVEGCAAEINTILNLSAEMLIFWLKRQEQRQDKAGLNDN